MLWSQHLNAFTTEPHKWVTCARVCFPSHLRPPGPSFWGQRKPPKVLGGLVTGLWLGSLVCVSEGLGEGGLGSFLLLILLLSLPVLPCSTLLISLRYGSQWKLLSLLCAGQSSPFARDCHPPPPPSHSALTGCLWRMQHIVVSDQGSSPQQGGESRTAGRWRAAVVWPVSEQLGPLGWLFSFTHHFCKHYFARLHAGKMQWMVSNQWWSKIFILATKYENIAREFVTKSQQMFVVAWCPWFYTSPHLYL